MTYINRQPQHRARVKLGERRTVLKKVPDAREIEGETIYLMAHQLCVPGGWETIASQQIRAPKGLEGKYGPIGQMLDPGPVRRRAGELFDLASKKLAKHPLRRLEELVSTVVLQERTGEEGGWDDSGVALEMAELLGDYIV